MKEALIGFETKGGKITGVVTEKRCLPADVVILGLGVRPNTELAATAGIPLGEQGAIRVNGRMQVPVAGIWAMRLLSHPAGTR